MTATTITEFKNDIYTRDVQLPEVASDAVFFSLLNRAIINVRPLLRGFEPDKFETWLENQTSPVTFPSDLVRGDTTLFFPKGEYKNPIGGQFISKRNGAWYVEGFDDFTIKYPKDIQRVTAFSDAFPFSEERSEEILISEMMALINGTLEENEATPAITNALTQSNRIR
jgi:hypothetical protein